MIRADDDQGVGPLDGVEQLLKCPVEFEQVGTRRVTPDPEAMPQAVEFRPIGIEILGARRG